MKLQDGLFSGDVSYGTAVPKRNRDKDGKVREFVVHKVGQSRQTERVKRKLPVSHLY